MGLIDNVLKDIIHGTTSLTLLVSGVLAFFFVAGMFYGIAFANQNTFWWPVYILVLILVLKVINDLKPKAKK